jgi:hypothetical protein
MRYFVIVYDRRQGRRLVTREFNESERDAALAERLHEMVSRREQKDVEVVLFGANSLDDLRKTHSRYFQSAEEIGAGIDPYKR